jgi:protein-tyrosine-phosphatase
MWKRQLIQLSTKNLQNRKGWLKMMSNNVWFTGLTNEEIITHCNDLSNDAVLKMEFGEKKTAIDIYKRLEKEIVELKEFISQNNDIRSPHYDMKRQFIRDLNKIDVETFETLFEIYNKLSK